MTHVGNSWIEFDSNGVPLGRWEWSDAEGMWVYRELSFFSKLLIYIFIEYIVLTLVILGVLVLGVLILLFLLFRKKRREKDAFSPLLIK